MGRIEKKIGPVEIDGPVFSAPMSGITDIAFRLIAKSFGVALVYIPLISAKALCIGNKKTFDLLASDPAERPVAVQIFGDNPETIARAVRILNKFPVDMIVSKPLLIVGFHEKPAMITENSRFDDINAS